MASVIGNVEIRSLVYVAPFASIRGDEGQAIYIGEKTNLQDGVVLHALETQDNGEVIEKNLVEYGGKKYAVYVGDNVSSAHQSQVYGPAIVDDNTFIGMQAISLHPTKVLLFRFLLSFSHTFFTNQFIFRMDIHLQKNIKQNEPLPVLLSGVSGRL